MRTEEIVAEIRRLPARKAAIERLNSTLEKYEGLWHNPEYVRLIDKIDRLKAELGRERRRQRGWP